MSDHVTRIEPHVCKLKGHFGELCDTTLEVHCSCGFAQDTDSKEHADVVRLGHPLDPEAQCVHYVTDGELRDLFARHCECRPLNLSRLEDDHAAIHDCDTGILAEVQSAIFDQHSVEADERRARARAVIASGIRLERW